MARIMVVEDEFLIANLLQDYIEELGHQVIGPASSVQEALALIDRDTPQFAILDLTLGREQSIPIADVLHRNRCAFAFATGHDAGALPDRFKSVPLLRKPYLFEDVKRVTELIGSSA